VERPKVIRGLLEREPRVGVATAGLTTAERHLVQTRRAETAFALRVLCLQALLTHPQGTTLFSRQGTLTDDQLDARIRVLRLQLSSMASSHATDFDDAALVARAAFQARSAESPAFLRLCALAHDLEPNDVTRIHAAQWMILNSEVRSSLVLLKGVISFTNGPFMDAAAAASMALAHHSLGDLVHSLEMYAVSSNRMNSYVPAAVGRLLVAVQLANTAQALIAARLLDEYNAPSSLEIQWQCAAEGSRRLFFQRRLTSGSRDLLERLADSTGPTSRTLLHAVL
jgi:hypothetical protein